MAVDIYGRNPGSDKNGDHIVEFFDSAHTHYPQLGKIPHVLTLTHPLYDVETTFRPGALSSPNFPKFTVITNEPNNLNTSIDLSNTVGTPHVMGLHLHSGHPKLREKYNPEIIKRKDMLSLYSADQLQKPEKAKIAEVCEKHPKLCNFYRFKEQDWVTSYDGACKAMEKSWYTLLPRGDFVLRNSIS